MNVKITETSDAIVYTVTEQGTVTPDTLTGMFYQCRDGVYSKSIPKDRLMFPHDLCRMESQYNAFIAQELQPGGRRREDLDRALMWLVSEFRQRQITWWLAGSCALYVRGIAVQPHDLDIMTTKTEIVKIRDVVFPYIVEPFHHVEDWVVKGFGVLDYGYRIDVAFDPEDRVDAEGPVDFGPYAAQHVECVAWQGESIKVPPLALHLRSNEIRGRHERVAQIRRYLSQTDGPFIDA